MPTNQKIIPPVAIGVIPDQWVGTSTLMLNAAGTWLAFGFYQHAALTLNEVRVFFNTKTGTLAATDLTCDIYSQVSGKPGVSLASSSTLSSVAGNAKFSSFTGFSLALSAGTHYFIVLKNVNGTPASNNMQYLWNKSFNQPTLTGIGNSIISIGGADVGETHNVFTTTNSGTAWTLSAFNAVTWRLGYSDGSYYGFMQGGEFGQNGNIYLTRESGVLFTTPAASAWSLRGGAFIVQVGAGTPTSDLRLRLYQGTTLVATSETLSHLFVTSTSGNVFIVLYFSSPQKLNPNTAYRLTVGVVSGGDASNLYIVQAYFIDTDSNSTALLPFASPTNTTGYPTATSFDGSTWTQQAAAMTIYALLLDTDAEFAPPWPRGGGMTGGFGA